MRNWLAAIRHEEFPIPEVGRKEAQGLWGCEGASIAPIGAREAREVALEILCLFVAILRRSGRVA